MKGIPGYEAGEGQTLQQVADWLDRMGAYYSARQAMDADPGESRSAVDGELGTPLPPSPTVDKQADSSDDEEGEG
jgi:hypothetical protein